MPRLRQVPRSQADASVLPVYDLLFGDRNPVAQPGTATGTPGDWWTVFALVPERHHGGVLPRHAGLHARSGRGTRRTRLMSRRRPGLFA